MTVVEDAAWPRVVIAPKETTKRNIIDDLETAAEAQYLSSAQAAKVRGRCGWLSANSAGRVGRVGQAVLKMLQYGVRTSANCPQKWYRP